MPKNPPPPQVRFLAKFIRGDGDACWQWTAHRCEDGYGTFRAGKMTKAHRYSYELFVGPIPVGMEIDHKCRNRGCVNPSHLEPVPHAVNIERAQPNYRSQWTACPRGHAFDAENTGIYINSGKRYCRACKRASGEAYRAAARLQSEVSHAH